jgi:hypothetical protein
MLFEVAEVPEKLGYSRKIDFFGYLDYSEKPPRL